MQLWLLSLTKQELVVACSIPFWKLTNRIIVRVIVHFEIYNINM